MSKTESHGTERKFNAKQVSCLLNITESYDGKQNHNFQ